MTFRYFANFGSSFVQLVRPVRALAFYFLEVIIHFCDFPKTLTPRLAFLYTDIMETLCQREPFLLYLAYNMGRMPECLLRHQIENNTKIHISRNTMWHKCNSDLVPYTQHSTIRPSSTSNALPSVPPVLHRVQ